MNTCGVVITAYQANRFILSAIDSIRNQKLPKDWKIEFYIGVDGCYETAEVLKNEHIPFFFSKENVGTYVLTNSLLEEAKKDDCQIFVRFDSDDIACEQFVENGIKNCTEYEFSKTYCLKSAENLLPIKGKNFTESHGSTFFTRKSLEKLGGYHHYRVACDTDFIRRATALDLCKDDYINKPKYLYRRIGTSLSNSKATGKKSQLRENVCAIMDKNFKQGIFKINPVTTSLEYCDNK